MISLRHHIASLVAVFLALAVGIALGGGPLSDLGRDDASASAATGEETEQAASFGDAFAVASAEALYDRGLAHRTISLLAMPGADPEVVSALAAEVETAGGTVTGRYDVRAALVEPGQKSLVDTLGSQLLTQLGDGSVAGDPPTYDRMGQLLGLALSGGQLPDSDVTAVRESLAGAELMDSAQGGARGRLVLVVLGEDTDPAVLIGLLTGLATTAKGVVVAGDSAAADGGLAELRAEPAAGDVATVDGTETRVGQVSVVLALIRALQVPGGSFGASGSDGAVPLT